MPGIHLQVYISIKNTEKMFYLCGMKCKVDFHRHAAVVLFAINPLDGSKET